MNVKEEREYYRNLERIISDTNKNYFSTNKEQNEMNIFQLLDHIDNKYPFLRNQLLGNFIDATQIEKSTKMDILNFMAKTEKGTICRWINEEGEELFLINNGYRLTNQSKQILVFGDYLNKGDIELLKKSVYGAVLKKDVRKVLEKIEQDKKQQKSLNFIQKLINNHYNIQTEKNESYISSFEQQFKECVKTFGDGSIKKSKDFLISNMTSPEKKQLRDSLSTIGVRNDTELETLLNKWTKEIEHPEYKKERTYKQSIKPREVLYTR